MPIWFQATVVLAIIWVLARLVKRRTPLLQRYFIPSSIVGGALLLLVGPQAIKIVPVELTSFLAGLPAILINIVFAGLFIGKKVPNVKTAWRQSGSMIAFGNTIAWGMYVVGAVLTLTILGPFFGAPNIYGTLLEVSYSGGHGTAAGLAPTFASFGQSSATDIALGLATFSIVSAVVIGIIVINIYNKKAGRVIDRVTMRAQQNRMIKNGYSLTHVARSVETDVRGNVLAILCVLSAIGIGWLMLYILTSAENAVLLGRTDMRIVAHMPLFTFAMFGGLVLQVFLRTLHLDGKVQQKTIQTYGSIALDLLIITAIGTLSLSAIAHNIVSFAILAVAGVAWVLVAFFGLAPRMFRKHWFEYGITDMGQALGTTATGLLLNRLADPLNRTGAREAFAYKQLAYEPFMGGGIVTVTAAVIVAELGLVPLLLVASLVCFFWLIAGLMLGAKRRIRLQRHLRIGKIALR